MVDLVRIEKDSELNWGRLVKSWATGVSHLPGVDIKKLPVPRTLQELKAQCGLEGVNVRITVPPKITGLTVLQHGPETFALRLPPKAMIEAAAEEFATGRSEYPAPHFYTIFWGPLNVGKDERVDLQSYRIGDYSIGQCG